MFGKVRIRTIQLQLYLLAITSQCREKAPSNKTPALTKIMNMDIWVVGTLNQLFVRVPKLKQIFQKNKVVTGKAPFFAIGPFCTHHSICLNTGF